MNKVIPEKVGVSSTRLDRIGRVMRRYGEQKKLAGLITMVARRGQIVHFECYGMMDIEADKPMQPDTIFRIASMTKPITCAAVMMLYEEGYFQLHDPVSKFIPAFKEVRVFSGVTASGLECVDPEREVTIRDLLTHTSGLVYGNPEGSPVEVMVWQADREAEAAKPDETLEEWIQRLVRLPLAHQPGEAWHYGLSTDVLGYLVEVISGQSFDVFLKQKIFDPLGMEDTSFYVPKEKIDRLTALYSPAADGDLQRIDSPAVSGTTKSRGFLSGGGGLVSTASDFMRFLQMLRKGGQWNDKRLLGRKTVELMTMNHIPNELMPIHFGPAALSGLGYGFGVGVVTNVAQYGVLTSKGTFGWSGSASTFFWVDPQEELIGLILSQFIPLGYYPISEEFQVLTYQAIVD